MADDIVQPVITKHQLFHAGIKTVYVCDHTAGKVYIEGDRGLLRYSGTNVEDVSKYPAFDESTTEPPALPEPEVIEPEPAPVVDASASVNNQLKQLGVYDTIQKAGVDQGPLTLDKLANPVTAQAGVTDGTGNLQQQEKHPETEGKTVDDLNPTPAKYQRHKSVNGSTYYTDANGNKVVKADIPDADLANVEDIEDKE